MRGRKDRPLGRERSKSFALPREESCLARCTLFPRHQVCPVLGAAVALKALSLSLPSWTPRMRNQTSTRTAGMSTTSCTCLCELGPAVPTRRTAAHACSSLPRTNWRLAVSHAALPGPSNGCFIAPRRQPWLLLPHHSLGRSCESLSFRTWWAERCLSHPEAVWLQSARGSGGCPLPAGGSPRSVCRW